MVDVDEFWARTEKIHEASESNKMVRHRERMQFDREVMNEFFGMMQGFKELKEYFFER